MQSVTENRIKLYFLYFINDVILDLFSHYVDEFILDGLIRVGRIFPHMSQSPQILVGI